MRINVRTLKSHGRNGQSGFALPAALLLVLVIAATSAIYTQMAVENLKGISMSQATEETFMSAEGAAHDIVRQMAVSPNLWLDRVPLPTNPSGYVEYSPIPYAATNGIPSCVGSACQRNLHPTGGGLLKNIGPIGAGGDTVDTDYLITEQLNPVDPPAGDITLNDRAAWSQVERLDQTMPISVGGDLANNPGSGAGAFAVRFRITGMSLKQVRTRIGQATVVMVVELPAA